MIRRPTAALTVMLCLSAWSAQAAVTVTVAEGEYRVKADAYEATVAADGCLTRLAIGGVEFLKPSSQTNRGMYFHQGASLVLNKIERQGDTVVVASSDKASMRFEFLSDRINLEVANLSPAGMNCYAVFTPEVTAASNGEGTFVRAPAKRDWTRSIWYAGKAKLTLDGCQSIWGPFESVYSVWSLGLAAGAKKSLVLLPGVADDEEAAKAKAAGSAPAAPATPATPATPAAGIALPPAKPSGDALSVKQDGYEAWVDKDGCLTNLVIGGKELLRPGVAISRGVYFHQSGVVVPTGEVARDGNTVTAKGPKAVARYAFAPKSVTITGSNLTDQPMTLFLVLDPQYNAVRTDDGRYSRPALNGSYQSSTWFCDQARVTITGSDRCWGPWTGPNQVVQINVEAKGQRAVTLDIGTTTAEEAAAIAKLPASGVKLAEPIVERDLTVHSPLNWQVFQRRTKSEGAIRLSGRVKPACDQVEVRVTGRSPAGELPGGWRRVPLAPRTRGFLAVLDTPAGGWYTVEVRALKDGQQVAETKIDQVGVGEVFVGAGQSNSTNCSEELLKVAGGMVATFSGSEWRVADDPQPGCHDKTGRGSFWPAFGDAMAERFKVPIGVAVTGHAGTSVNAWQPGGELFNWFETRVLQLGPGGFRAVLWHQGESDVGMSAADYEDRLSRVIRGAQSTAGWEFPFFVAQVSYHNPANPSYPSTRTAQKSLWDKGVALEGPDTDTLGGDHRERNGQGIHFSGKGQRAHGQMWADKVGAWLEQALGS